MPAAALAVYLATLAPGVIGFDSAELVTGAYTLGIVHPTGYPLYLLLGYLFTWLPFGSVGFRVNLLSAFSAAIAVWLVARLAYSLTRSRPAAWAAAGGLAFAYSFWRLSVVAEVYTLHALLVLLILFLLERWLATGRSAYLLGVGLAAGLSLSNHISSVLLGPGVLVALLAHPSRRRLLRHAPGLLLMLALGLSFYLYFPIRDAADPPLNYVRSYYDVDLRTAQGVWWMASGQAYRFFAFGYDLTAYLGELADFARHLARNFTVLGIALGLAGGLRMLRRHRPFGWSLLIGFVATVGFFAGYAVGDKATMYVAAYVIWAVWLAVGAAWILEAVAAFRHWRGGESRVLARAAELSLAGVVVVTCLANWRWADQSEAVEAESFARQTLSSVAPDATIVGQWSTAVILEYFQTVEGIRPDVEIFNRSRYEVAEYYRLWKEGVPHAQAVGRILESEKRLFASVVESSWIYVLEYDPRLEPEYEYQPVGNLFRLIPR